ncbi:MAG: SEL1-like repeat protein [Chitinophagaceae bacterium]|nr:SEL1-like repeat protein [Chitinophagaceae bacterium]
MNLSAFIRILALLVFSHFPFVLIAQSSGVVSFFSDDIDSSLCKNHVSNFKEDQQVRKLIDTILHRMHLRNAINIIGCNDDRNCKATLVEATPYIIYNSDFLNGVKLLHFTETSLPNKEDDWEALCILAHELGHIYNFHFGSRNTGRTSIDLELEADEFAGVMMKTLGANLAQAQKVMQRRGISDKGSETHPSRQKRLEAIERGWNNAGNPFANSEAEKKEVIVKQELLEASRHYDQQDVAKALPVYLKFTESEHFNPTYQTDLGLMYYRGNASTSPNYTESARWLQKAAMENDDRAQLYLGFMYMKGLGHEVNYEQALLWLKKSAEAGNTNAMLALCEVDSLSNEILWLTQAASKGNSTAQALLGEKYLYGLNNLPIDTALGFAYLRKAINRDNALAYVLYGKKMAEKKSKEQLEKVVTTFLEPGAICLIQNKNLFLTSDSLSKTDESDFVNRLYFNNEHVDIFVSACAPIVSYYSGDGDIPVNMETCIEWMEVMARYGDTEVAYFLGQLFEKGKMNKFKSPVNYKKAGEMYKLAANNNHVKAKEALERFK